MRTQRSPEWIGTSWRRMASSTTAWVCAPNAALKRERLGLSRTVLGSGRHVKRPIATCRRMRRTTQKTLLMRNTASEDDVAVAAAPGTWNGSDIDAEKLVSMVKFDKAGLVPAVAQQWDTGEVLMMAWMSAESIRETLRGGRAVYYSRSRKALWRKGDTSGQVQVLCDFFLDCDGDTVLVKVDQLGVACHTGRRSCFYTAFRPPSGNPEITMDVLTDPKQLYGSVAK